MLKSALLALMLLAQGSAQAVQANLPNFEPGQEWSIKSTSPTSAKIIIGRVEPWGGKVCVNVSIVDVPIPKGVPGAGGVTEIAHVPFDKIALATSVDRLLVTHVPPSPNFETGYKQWQDAKGGIFTISAEKAIEFMFQTITRRPTGQQKG